MEQHTVRMLSFHPHPSVNNRTPTTTLAEHTAEMLAHPQITPEQSTFFKSSWLDIKNLPYMKQKHYFREGNDPIISTRIISI